MDENITPRTREDLPEHLDIPQEFYPKNTGPGGMSPQVMWAHAHAVNRSEYYHEYDGMKSWVILFLLDQANRYWKIIEAVENDTLAKDGFEMIQAAMRNDGA